MISIENFRKIVGGAVILLGLLILSIIIMFIEFMPGAFILVGFFVVLVLFGIGIVIFTKKENMSEKTEG